jgi:predicted nucleic acid-binding protein
MPPYWPKPAAAMIAIDTNIVVRFLTGDNAEQSARAQALIDGQQVFLSVTVALETDWVLRSAYGFRPSEVIHALRAFGGLPTVTVEDAEAVARALDMAEAGLDFADALHLTRAAQCTAFATFDHRLLRRAGSTGPVQVTEP